MRAFVYRDGTARELSFAEAIKIPRDGGLIWLHFDGRNADAVAWLRAQADIPPVAREAVLAHETRPRADVFGAGAVINLRGLGTTPDDDPDVLVSTRFWADKGRVISFGFRTALALEDVVQRFLAGTVQDPGDLLANFAQIHPLVIFLITKSSQSILNIGGLLHMINMKLDIKPPDEENKREMLSMRQEHSAGEFS